MVQLSRMVPPQNWNDPDISATCHGIMLGAASPPTILLAACIKLGISAQPPAGGVGAAVVVPGGGGAGVVVGPPALGSKHSQAEQYCVLTLSPQQSPPSQPHSALLFSSSQ